MILKKRLIRNYHNFKGKRLIGKYVIIQSDDWGSIRMPSKSVYNNLLKNGIEVDKCHYTKFDCLENSEDLCVLFETLNRFKDQHENHPIITMNYVMANPDFQKIRANCFSDYYYETFIQTYNNYSKSNNVHSLILEGLNSNLILPQFHAREHLNITRWLRALKLQLKETMIAFENNLFGISTTISKEKRKSYMAAFDFDSPKELLIQKSILADGLKLFKEIFGFDSASFIAPNYIWHPEIEHFLLKFNIKYLQSSLVQIIPSNGNYFAKRNYFMMENKFNQVYLPRNINFEPSSNPNLDWVDNALNEIRNAFFWRQPAIISTHRVNYIGSIFPENRDRNIKSLGKLLEIIIKKYPDVQFITHQTFSHNLVK